jgi:hypothetical protein
MDNPTITTPSLITPVTDDNSRSILDSVDNDVTDKNIPAPEEDETPDKEEIPTDTPAELDDEDTPKGEETEEDEEAEGGELDADTSNLIAALKKTDPEIFRKHPELRKALYKEQQYSSLFPTLEEAREVSERHEGFTRLEAEIMEGKPDSLIGALAKVSPDTLYEFANNFLPILVKTDKAVYAEVMQVPLKRAIQNVYLEGKRTNNENLQNAALFVDQALFDGGIAELPKGRKKEEENPEVTRLRKERDEHVQRAKGNFNTEVIEIIKHKTDKEIRTSLEKLEFSEYERKNVIRDISTEIQNVLASDKRYQASISSLMKQAESAGFTSDWKARVSSAFLARAKAVLPIAKKKVIAEVTGKMERTNPVKRLVPSNSSSRVSSSLDASKIDKSKTSMLDILNDTVTMRK